MEQKTIWSETSIGVSDAQLPLLAAFLCEIFQNEMFSAKYLDWLYNKNPFGNAVCITVYSENQIIGHIAGLPREYSNGFEGSYKGFLAVNTSVDRKFLKLRIFNDLIKALINEKDSRGYEFILGIPNRNALNGWLKRGKALYLGKLNLYFSLFIFPIPSNKILTFTKQNEMQIWLSNDPFHKRKSGDFILNSKFIFFPFWFFSIISFLNKDGSYSNSSRSLIFGFIGKEPPKTPALRLPDFLKPAPLHVILIAEKQEVFSFFSKTEIQAKDFDAL